MGDSSASPCRRGAGRVSTHGDAGQPYGAAAAESWQSRAGLRSLPCYTPRTDAAVHRWTIYRDVHKKTDTFLL